MFCLCSSDVAKLVLCLGGINTVDLFNMKKSDYRHGALCYKRAKTRHSRRDEAYIEMRVEPFIMSVFEKYLASEDDEYLFTFHNRYCDSDSFSANVNNGIRKICKDMGMQKEDYYCVYTYWKTNRDNIVTYWTDRVKESKENEAIYTMGMRGIHDSSMLGYSNNEEKRNALIDVIQTQRNILSENLGKDAAGIPQMFNP